MTPTRLVALLLPLALLAGCFSGDETTPAAAVTPASPTPPGGGTTPVPDANATATPEAAPAPVELPIALDGKLDTYAAVCEMQHLGECVDTPTGSGDNVWIQEAAGSPRAVRVEMTWTAASAATQTLGLMAMACWETEEGGMDCEHVDGKEGASPLAIDVGGLALPENAILRVFGYYPNSLPQSPVPGAWAFYEVEQSFRLDGVAVVQPPAEA